MVLAALYDLLKGNDVWVRYSAKRRDFILEQSLIDNPVQMLDDLDSESLFG